MDPMSLDVVDGTECPVGFPKHSYRKQVHSTHSITEPGCGYIYNSFLVYFLFHTMEYKFHETEDSNCFKRQYTIIIKNTDLRIRIIVWGTIFNLFTSQFPHL